MEDLTQEDFDGICEWVSTQSRSSSAPVQAPVSTECWLRFLDGLTSDRPNNRSFVPANEPSSSQEPVVETEVTSKWPPLSSCTVPQQLLPFITKYNFETCRTTYFGSFSPSKSQKSLSCDYFPDNKCKQSPYPVITTCRKVPSCSLCARCGSLGDHTMVHCLGCCEVYHYFCAHLPERLVPQLTSWFCHRCVVCSICTGKEVNGKKFVSDIIEICFRCQNQYHVHCQRMNNFSIIHKDTSKQMKICNRCLFRLSCKRCRSIISPDEVYRECCELSSRVCVECRNLSERDLCRQCIFHLRCDLRKVVCQNCRDVYHSDCLSDTDNFRLETGLPFLCSGCIPLSAVVRGPDRWSIQTGRAMLDILRAEIIQHMNESFNRIEKFPRKKFFFRNSSEEIFEISHFSRKKENFASGKNVDQSVPAATNLPQEAFFESESHQESILRGQKQRNSDQDEGIGEEVGDGHVTSSGCDMDQEVSQPSPDSGVTTKSDNKGRSPCPSGDSVEEDSSNNSSEKLKSLAWYYMKSNGDTQILPILTSVTFGAPSNVLDDPVFLLDKISVLQRNVDGAVVASKKNSFDFNRKISGWHSIFLRKLDQLSQDEEICGDPKKFVKTVRELTGGHFSSAFRRTLESVVLQFSICRSEKKNSRISVFPVLRRGTEPPPSVVYQSDSQEEEFPVKILTKKLRMIDERLCFFCCVAGDDNTNYAGRLLSIGYDLWAHIGCLSFASTRKRVFDYTVYKLSNLESPNYRRSECALCPIPLGVVGCAQKRCRNSYHLNCAVVENCLFSTCLLTGALGTVCPEHRQDNLADEHRVKAMRLIDLERSFLEMPIFARSPPTNVQALGNPSWSTGVRKQDVKVHIGTAFVEELGRLARGWETKDLLLPCGYKMHRVFWSALMPHQLTRYTFVVLDMNAHPEIKALICAVLEREDLPDWEYLKKRRTDRLTSLPLHSTNLSSFDNLWQNDDDQPIPGEFQNEKSVEKVTRRNSPFSKTSSSVFNDVPSRDDNVPFLINDVPDEATPIVLNQESEGCPNSARSRSSSPEIPVCRQPISQNFPIKRSRSRSRSRSPSLSPVFEAKRPSVFPKESADPSRDFTVEGFSTETVCSGPLFSRPPSAARSTKNPSPSPEISQPRRPFKIPTNTLVAPPSDLNASIFVEDFEADGRKQIKRKKGRPPKLSALSLDVSITLSHLPFPDPGVSETDAVISPAPSVEILPKGFFFSPRKSARLVELQSSMQTQNVWQHQATPYSQKSIGFQSCLREFGGRERCSKGVKFSNRVNERIFESSFFDLPLHYMADPSVEPDPGPYFPPRQDFDPNPDSFTAAKHRGRIEIEKTRKNRKKKLIEKIQKSEISFISKQPSQICVLIGQDGFFAVSHWPEELVSHLFDDIQRNRRTSGVMTTSPAGLSVGLTPGQFVGLSYPVVRFLLEQLPIPSNSSKIYTRTFFTKEALRARPKLELKPLDVEFSLKREITCWTCPLPLHCFTIVDGRTYMKVPVVERQVVFKWSAPYHVVSDLKDASTKWIRIFNSSFVDPADFPEWYEDVRHDQSQTFVLSYALHPQENLVFLALIAKQNFGVGVEVRFDPQREPHRVKDALGVADFGCSKHGRIF